MRRAAKFGRRRTAGLVAGAVIAVVEAAFVAGIGLAALPLALTRRPLDGLIDSTTRHAGALARWDRQRMIRWFDAAPGEPVVPRSVLAFLATRAGTGLLGGSILVLVGWGVVTTVFSLLSGTAMS